MSSLPKISIITPSYNQAQFIEQTIKSVLNQHYPNLEYIVMDGGSTDGTIDILKKYDRYFQWRSASDRGQSDAINQGLRLSTGEIVAYLNSDDLYELGALHLVGQHFAKQPNLQWVTGFYTIIDEHGQRCRSMISRYKEWWLKRYRWETLLVLNYIAQPATFWRRSTIEDIGLFNEEEHLVMDYEYWLRIGQKYPIGLIPHRLAAFRIHHHSKSHQAFRDQLIKEAEIAARFSSSPALKFLHRFHAQSITAAYQLLAAFEKPL